MVLGNAIIWIVGKTGMTNKSLRPFQVLKPEKLPDSFGHTDLFSSQNPISQDFYSVYLAIFDHKRFVVAAFTYNI